MDLRCYLVEKLFPALVCGLEKTLQQAEKRELVDADNLGSQDAHPPFSPVTYLAQYLMRNNPKFSNFGAAGTYAQSMHVVQEELRDRMYTVSGNRQAKVQADVQRRRLELEKKRQRDLASQKAKLQPVLDRFPVWEVQSSAGIERAELVEAFRAHKTGPVTEQMAATLLDSDEGGAAKVDGETFSQLLLPNASTYSDDELASMLTTFDEFFNVPKVCLTS